MPPIPRDYRNYTNPRIWSIEFLLHLIKLNKDTFGSEDISECFNIKSREVNARLNVLKRCGFIRRISEKHRKPYTYQITKWGKKYVSDNKNKLESKIAKKREGKK